MCINTMSLCSAHSDFPKLFSSFQIHFRNFQLSSNSQIPYEMGRQASGGQSLHDRDTEVVALQSRDPYKAVF